MHSRAVLGGIGAIASMFWAAKSNYAINPTPEPDVRSNRAILPARVIAALDLFGRHVEIPLIRLA